MGRDDYEHLREQVVILRGHVAQLEESLAYERERSVRLLQKLKELRSKVEQQQKWEPVQSMESVTQYQVDSLCRSLSPVAIMVSGLMDVDVSRGRGILEAEGGKSRHCLWTSEGCRVTVSVSPHGVIVTKSKSPDPGAPDGTR